MPGPESSRRRQTHTADFSKFDRFTACTLVHIRLDTVKYSIYSNFSVRRFSFPSTMTILTCNGLLASILVLFQIEPINFLVGRLVVVGTEISYGSSPNPPRLGNRVTLGFCSSTARKKNLK
jgi:hypothetical protein